MRLFRVLLPLLFLLAASMGGRSALAQNLQNLPGLTEIQQPAATTIQQICGPLNDRTTAGLNTPLQAQLGRECTKMVRSANVLAGTGNQTGGLGLSNKQLRDAMQGIAPEEVAIQGRGAVETAGRNPIGARLFALRGGVRGFTIAANGSGAKMPSSYADNAALAPLQSGGSAGENDAVGRLGGFVNINYNTGDKDKTTREDGFDFDNTGITAGVDYRFSDSFVGGVALSYAETDADIADSLGNVETEGQAGTLYGSYYAGDFYVDANLSYSQHDFETRRNIVVVSQTSEPGINTAARGDTEGDQFSGSLGAGYDVRRGTLTITPYGRLSYLKLEIDAYRESEPASGLGLDIGEQSVKSFQSGLGVKLAWTISTASGVVVPYASAEWNHEFKNDSRSLTAKYTNDPFNTFFVIPTDTPDRNYFTLGAGVSGVFANGLAAFVSVETVVGLEDVKNHGIAIGVRKEF